eukprot:gene3674-8338_t
MTEPVLCSSDMCAILVPPQDANVARQIAESNGVYDMSRRIAKHANDDPRLAIPITTGCKDNIPIGLQTYDLIEGVDLPHSASWISKQQSPYQVMVDSLINLVRRVRPTLSEKEIEHARRTISKHWEEHGDVILFPANSFNHPIWNDLGSCVWEVIVSNMNRFTRVAFQQAVNSNLMRTSSARLVYGDSGIVTHIDNGISYTYDITKLMFSRGNITEKIRVAAFNCDGEVVVDLFAGIGYFTLPYLVHARAQKVYACEWNPTAVEMLKHNLAANHVIDRCEIFTGDNRTFPLKGIADRINLGLIPTSRASWNVAVNTLNKEKGGWLHIHENVTCPDKDRKHAHSTAAQAVALDIKKLLRENAPSSCDWSVNVRHIEFVKSYAPRIHHLVFDVECRPPSSVSQLLKEVAADTIDITTKSHS